MRSPWSVGLCTQSCRLTCVYQCVRCVDICYVLQRINMQNSFSRFSLTAKRVHRQHDSFRVASTRLLTGCPFGSWRSPVNPGVISSLLLHLLFHTESNQGSCSSPRTLDLAPLTPHLPFPCSIQPHWPPRVSGTHQSCSQQWLLSPLPAGPKEPQAALLTSEVSH